LGRGHLAFREYEQAREELERAWRAGYRTPELAHSLGLALGALYQKALEEALRIETPAIREKRIAQLEKTLRDPALEHLRAARGESTEPSFYVEGLIALYEKRYDDALEKARQAFEQAPWLYEAKQLSGQIHATLGRQGWDKGDRDGARIHYDRAARAYSEAVEIGRSDPRLYEAECSLAISTFQFDLGRRALPTSTLEGVLAHCETALRADPGSDRALALECLALWRWGEHLHARGEEAGPTLAAAVAKGQEAVRLNPGNAHAFHTLGSAFSVLAEDQMRHGRDALPSLRLAIEAGEKAVALEPANDAFLGNLGISYLIEAEHGLESGGDPRASLKRATALFDAALRVESENHAAWTSLGSVYQDQGQFEMSRGLDPRPSLARAADAYRRALVINPADTTPLGQLAVALAWIGEHESAVGGDPRASFDAAIAAQEKALEAYPEEPTYLSNFSEILRLRARHAFEAGEDPRPFLNRGLDSTRRAARIDARYPSPHENAATSLLLLAEWELGARLDPQASLERARQEAREALRLEASAANHGILGRIDVVAARAALAHRKDPSASLQRAEEALGRALALSPSDPNLLAARAEQRRYRAEWRDSRGERPDDDVREGLAAVEKALSVRPNTASFLALRAALFVSRARLEADASSRAEAARSAETAFGEAFRINPRLGREYQPSLAVAQRLAAVAR
jgi:serine/threonine-protein kinase